jgi:hypothetical protein
MNFLLRIKKWLFGLFNKKDFVILKGSDIPDIPRTAREVVDDYISFPYCGVELVLRKEEKKHFDKLPREERRKIAYRFKDAVKKGRIKLIKTNGKTIAVINKQYEINKRRNKESAPARE